jgi:hypothetical protein
MKVIFFLSTLLCFCASSFCQKIYFPASAFADSLSLAKSIPSLAEQTIARSGAPGSPRDYNNLVLLQLASKKYAASLTAITTAAASFVHDTSVAKAVYFNYRIYCLAEGASKGDSFLFFQ